MTWRKQLKKPADFCQTQKVLTNFATMEKEVRTQDHEVYRMMHKTYFVLVTVAIGVLVVGTLICFGFVAIAFLCIKGTENVRINSLNLIPHLFTFNIHSSAIMFASSQWWFCLLSWQSSQLWASFHSQFPALFQHWSTEEFTATNFLFFTHYSPTSVMSMNVAWPHNTASLTLRFKPNWVISKTRTFLSTFCENQKSHKDQILRISLHYLQTDQSTTFCCIFFYTCKNTSLWPLECSPMSLNKI